MSDLDRDSIVACDPTGQVAGTLGLPEHLRDALWRVYSAGIEPVDAPGGLIVAGMGGSSIGGRLARAAIGPRARRSLTVVGGYTLPAWAGPDTVVLCGGYSGANGEALG